MNIKLRIALAAGLLCSIDVVDESRLASAQTTGDQHFDGVVVASGKSGTRETVSSVIIGRGVLRGVGRIVEIDSRPTDPEDLSRDDLVFRDGTLHLSIVNRDFNFSFDSRTCVFTASIQQTGAIEGGTGQYAAAAGTFSGSVAARGLLPRASDGTCAQDQAPIIEVDTVTAEGTLSL